MAKGKGKPRNTSKRGKDEANYKRSAKYDRYMKSTDSKTMDKDPRNFEIYAGSNADVANIAFNNVLGLKSRFIWAHDENAHIQEDIFGVPGVMSLHAIPTLGGASQSNDAVNVLSQRVYSYVRHANSGHANYDPSDYMMYILAVSSQYLVLTHLMRVYGIATTYSRSNRYLPKALIQACHLNFETLISDLPRYRARVNQIAYALSSFAVPKLTYIDESMKDFAGYYIDDESINKAQSYIIVPRGYYDFQLDEDSKGMLKWTNFAWPYDGSGNMDPFNMLDTIWASVSKLLQNEDFGIMSGDTLKAFGDSNIYSIGRLSEEYAIAPTNDSIALRQIQESTVLDCADNVWSWDYKKFQDTFGADTLPQEDFETYANSMTLFNNDHRTWDITQSDNGVIQQEHWYAGTTFVRMLLGDNANSFAYPQSIILNSEGHPGPDEIMDLTRYKVLGEPFNSTLPGASGATCVRLDRTGHIVFCGLETFGFDFQSEGTDRGNWTLRRYDMGPTYGTTQLKSGIEGITNARYANIGAWMTRTCAFKYAPFYYECVTDVNGELLDTLMSIPWANYAVISRNELIRMHEMAIYGLFVVPDMTGSFGTILDK